MITGIHNLIYAKNVDKVREFFRDVLEFPAVDAGHGWLIFGLPPAELGIHPTEAEPEHEMYLMCDDVEATVTELMNKGVEFSRPITDSGFGKVTSIKLPGGGELGLYQPKHPTALHLGE